MRSFLTPLIALALLGCACTGWAAASGVPAQTPDGNQGWEYTFDCADGSQGTTYTDAELTPEQESAAKTKACGESAEPRPVQGLRALALKLDKDALLTQTLADLRANRFTLRVRCSRACRFGGTIQVGWAVAGGRARVLTVIGKPKRLAGASFTNVVVKLSPSQLSALRGAKADVHVRGFSSAVALDDGAQALNTWQRTCPVHKS